MYVRGGSPVSERQAVSSRSNRPAAPGWFPRPSGRAASGPGISPVHRAGRRTHSHPAATRHSIAISGAIAREITIRPRW